MQQFIEGPFQIGLDSVTEPCNLQPGSYQYLLNGINKGGIISTRPGFNNLRVITQANNFLHLNPQGIKLFTPRDGLPTLIVVAGGQIYYLKYPFTANWATLHAADGTDVLFDQFANVEMEVAVIGVTEATDGTLTAIDPYPVLIICDGLTRSAIWDGAATARYLDPDPSGAHETPVSTWMKWIGNRLWTMQGKKIRVSNLLNPIKFTEEDILIEGGYFNLPDNGTGFGVTPDFRSLLAFTDFTTTSFQAGIVNRASWNSTPDFQKVIFSNIGCAAGRSITNQYGMTWWYSHGGLMNLDNALQTYRSSEIKYKDQAMRRSRANFSTDISGICATSYENLLLLSAPSGDIENYHTWVMDENPNEILDTPAIWSSVWTGIRPVQYATGIINGSLRCFAISKDLPAAADTAGTPFSANVWELFTPDKRDIGSGAVATPILVKDVSCAIETRFVSVNALSEVKYIELDLQEISGTVQIDIYYCARKGTYKRLGTKQIVGTVGSVTSAMTVPVIFGQYLPQKRTIKSVNECVLAADTNPAVETPNIRSVDKYFSFLIRWTGQMSISKMRIFVDPFPEQMDGASEINETTDRYIRPNGTGAVLSTGPTALPITPQQSGFISTVSPRWSEGIYQSLV